MALLDVLSVTELMNIRLVLASVIRDEEASLLLGDSSLLLEEDLSVELFDPIVCTT